MSMFETVSSHGTRVVIYNSWQDKNGNMELNFESDLEDICIIWDGKDTQKEGSSKVASEQHLVNHLRYALCMLWVFPKYIRRVILCQMWHTRCVGGRRGCAYYGSFRRSYTKYRSFRYSEQLS